MKTILTDLKLKWYIKISSSTNPFPTRSKIKFESHLSKIASRICAGRGLAELGGGDGFPILHHPSKVRLRTMYVQQNEPTRQDNISSVLNYETHTHQAYWTCETIQQVYWITRQYIEFTEPTTQYIECTELPDNTSSILNLPDNTSSVLNLQDNTSSVLSLRDNISSLLNLQGNKLSVLNRLVNTPYVLNL